MLSDHQAQHRINWIKENITMDTSSEAGEQSSFHVDNHSVYMYMKHAVLSNASQKALIGRFIPPSDLDQDDTPNQIILHKENTLQMLSFDSENDDHPRTICEQYCFGRIVDCDVLAAAAFGSDCIVLLAEDGTLTTAEYSVEGRRFVAVDRVDLFSAVKQINENENEMQGDGKLPALVQSTRSLPSQRVICDRSGRYVVVCGLEDNVYCYSTEITDSERTRRIKPCRGVCICSFL